MRSNQEKKPASPLWLRCSHIFLLPLREKVAEGRMRGCAASAAQRVIGAQARQPLTRSVHLQKLALQALSRRGRGRNPWLRFGSHHEGEVGKSMAESHFIML